MPVRRIAGHLPLKSFRLKSLPIEALENSVTNRKESVASQSMVYLRSSFRGRFKKNTPWKLANWSLLLPVCHTAQNIVVNTIYNAAFAIKIKASVDAGETGKKALLVVPAVSPTTDKTARKDMTGEKSLDYVACAVRHHHPIPNVIHVALSLLAI